VGGFFEEFTQFKLDCTTVFSSLVVESEEMNFVRAKSWIDLSDVPTAFTNSFVCCVAFYTCNLNLL
jgi:hypothetical protein